MPTGGKNQPKTDHRKKPTPTKRTPCTRSKALSTPAQSGTDESNSSTDDELSLGGQSSGQSKGSSPNSKLKNAIVKQIALSLRSSSLIKRIANDVYDVIATKLEERVTEEVYQAVSMDLKKYTNEVGAMNQKISEMKEETKIL